MTNCKPLYHKYKRHLTHQPAFLTINEFGMISVDWCPEVGTSLPYDILSGRSVRFPVSNMLSHDEIDRLIAIVTPFAKKLMMQTSSMVWDGKKRKRTFSEGGQIIIKCISAICDAYIYSTSMPCGKTNCDYCSHRVYA